MAFARFQVKSSVVRIRPADIATRLLAPARNLLLDDQGTVWITDFGLAKVADQRDLTCTGDFRVTAHTSCPRVRRVKQVARVTRAAHDISGRFVSRTRQRPLLGASPRGREGRGGAVWSGSSPLTPTLSPQGRGRQVFV